MWRSNPLHKNKGWCCFFNWRVFITNSWNIDISRKKRLCSTVELLSVVGVILFNIYKIYKRFYLFKGRFEVLKLQYFKPLSQRCIQNLLRHLRWNFLLKVLLQIHTFLIFATLRLRWDNAISTLKQRWNDVVQGWKTAASTLCKFESTLLQCWTP